MKPNSQEKEAYLMKLSDKFKEDKKSEEKKISQKSEKDEISDNLEIHEPLTNDLIFDMNKQIE